jgi:hypothetical protein
MLLFTRIAGAVLVAAAAAVVLVVPTILGVETWKWALGVLGAVLFVAAGRRK